MQRKKRTPEITSVSNTAKRVENAMHFTPPVAQWANGKYFRWLQTM